MRQTRKKLTCAVCGKKKELVFAKSDGAVGPAVKCGCGLSRAYWPDDMPDKDEDSLEDVLDTVHEINSQGASLRRSRRGRAV